MPCDYELTLPTADKYIDFQSELGENGQYDEIALQMYLDDNPDHPHCEQCMFRYDRGLQSNFQLRRLYMGAKLG